MSSTQKLGTVSYAHRRRLRAARSACSFLRRQAELSSSSDKRKQAEVVWDLYWKMHSLGLLAVPRATRRMLRQRYGFWSAAGVSRLKVREACAAAAEVQQQS